MIPSDLTPRQWALVDAHWQRRRNYDYNEPAAMNRLQQPALLTDQELRDIVVDWHAGYAREVASNELDRRATLTAHERIRESALRARES